MANLNTHAKRTAVIVALLILLSMFLRIMWQYLPSNNLRGLIYIGLFAAWGVSIQRRIIQVQARRYLTAISILMVFWVVARSTKFMLFADTNLGRYCWYLYYLPMLFIPLLVLLVELSLGKPEDFRLPRWADYLFLVSASLFVLVLTNDFHQLAFGFPKGLLFYGNDDYSHELVYFLSIGWMAFCTVPALVVMILKCHLPSNRKRIWLPCAPVLALIVYSVLYVTAWDFIEPFAGDMTVVSCLLITATLESCIQCGLIQSNSHYWELFSAATSLSAQITNNDYAVRYASSDALTIPIEQMREAESAPVLLTRGTRLHNMPVKGGHAVWTEDISQLLALHEELKEVQEELNERNALLRHEYEQEKERKSIEEQNQLYNLLESTTQKQIDKISLLVREYHNSEAKKTILAQIAVLSSFVKRRKHLALSVYNSYSIAESELTAALQECVNTLKLLAVRGRLSVDTGFDYLPGEAVTLAYDFFEDVLEAAMDDLRSVLINISTIDNCPHVSIRLFCSANLTTLQLCYPNAKITSEEEDEWLLVLPLFKGGDQG